MNYDDLRPKRSRTIRKEFKDSRRRNEHDTKELKNLIILDKSKRKEPYPFVSD